MVVGTLLEIGYIAISHRPLTVCNLAGPKKKKPEPKTILFAKTVLVNIFLNSFALLQFSAAAHYMLL